MSKILIEEATVKQVIAAIKKCHYYMIDADLPEQSMLVEAYKAYAALEAALAEQPAQQEIVQRYSPDGEGGMEIDSLGAWVKFTSPLAPAQAADG
jgi:hypothetical protein